MAAPSSSASNKTMSVPSANNNLGEDACPLFNFGPPKQSKLTKKISTASSSGMESNRSSSCYSSSEDDRSPRVSTGEAPQQHLLTGGGSSQASPQVSTEEERQHQLTTSSQASTESKDTSQSSEGKSVQFSVGSVKPIRDSMHLDSDEMLLDPMKVVFEDTL